MSSTDHNAASGSIERADIEDFETSETIAPDDLSVSDTVAVGGSMPASKSAHGASAKATTDVMPSDAMLGEVIGNYRLLELLGEGGMGRVYLAEHTKIGRKVALKMLHSHLASSADVVRRFFDEARAVNQIHHEHIVEITDFVENEEGNNYVIMEYLRGCSLSDLIKRRDGELTLARTLDIGMQVSSALAAVHEADIIHRDLKPENIFLTERGGRKDFVKLLDFGIAKLSGARADGMDLQTTEAGVIMGTPDYMSPQQASAEAVDFRTDIYSLGVILYEMATGRLPFKAASFGDLVVMHRTQSPTAPVSLPELPEPIPMELNDVIMHCLEKEPEDRPRSCKEVEVALQAVVDEYGADLSAFTATPSRSTGEGASKGKGLALLGGGLLAAALGGLVFAMGSGGSKEKAENTPAPPAEVAVEKAATPPTPPREEAAPPVETEPEPPASVSVQLQFRSEPEGAMVYRVGQGEEELLGVTPFDLARPLEDRAIAVAFRKQGYDEVVRSHRLTEGGELSVTLVSTPTPTAKQGKGQGRERPIKTPEATSNVDEPTTVESGDPMYEEGAVMDPFKK